MRRRSGFAVVSLLVLTLAGCTGAPGAREGGETQLESLQQAIDAGAKCPDLLRMLDEIDEDATEFSSAQGELINVGCFTRDSARNDAELSAEASASPWLGVPGQEVSPSAHCTEASAAAAREIDATAAEPLIAETLNACVTVDEWMSALASHPGMMGMTEGYIPRLLDLETVCYEYIDSAACQDALARGLEVGP